ncbi:MAG: DUF488 domain-containing protein [Zavarzinella sp.]|nr:DUF488 domain-containing protein [Zavarzinella sp.]
MVEPLPQVRLFTIGHSDHSAEVFLDLLRSHGVTALADVRSSPYSRRHPQFNREALAAELERAGVRYVFLGAELGARRAESECYEDGKARYPLIARSPLFVQGLERVRQGAEKYRVALLCAEKDPLTCHRAILVCRHLRDSMAPIQHIREDGRLESHGELESRLLAAAGLSEGDLFQSREELLEQAYDWQGERIAYEEERPTEAVS